MFRALRLLPALMLFGSCQAPPRPPTVDESTKRPANSVSAVQLQSCRSDLQNTRILLNDAIRPTEAARSVTAQLRGRRDGTGPAPDGGEYRNVVYSVLFAFGSARMGLADTSTTQLVTQARSAPMVLLRARTDGTTASAAENRVVQARAAAVQAWLVAAGVDPARIRATWQPVGDYAADNTLPGGRTLNRRVEIEIYRAAPDIVALNRAPSPSPHSSARTLSSPPNEDDHGR